jgi:hypothetical protein
MKGSLTGEQKIRYEARLSVKSDPQNAILILSWRLTYIHERKRPMQQPKCAIDSSIKPRMISTGAKCDKILLMVNVLLFRIMEWVVGLDVVPHAAVFRLRRPTRRK